MSLRSKLVALAAAAVVAVSAVPVPALAVGPATFVTDAYANHWGRSDLRAYLNGYEKTDGSAPLNSTKAASSPSDYASRFSESEYALIQPVTYSTNVLYMGGNAASVYETTDRLYLPSGNYSNDQVIYWGSEDISANSAYAAAAQYDIARFIPVSYWSGGADNPSYLRSAAPSYSWNALTSRRGSYVWDDPVDGNAGAAPIMKVNINNVSFAAAASAAELAVDGNSGSKTITIAGSSDFGKKTRDNLPDYGMYLKTRSTDEFEPMTVAFSGNSMLIEYYGRDQGKYVVVQAYGDDDLQGGTVVYAAAAKIDFVGFGYAGIDVSDWGLANLDGYTIKVWMEDASEGSSLALATEPVTFVGRGGQVERTDEGAVKNLRVFAAADELQTSWGDLTALSESDREAVLGGRETVAGTIAGSNPTNQKIYFGEKDGQPLQFWIAGRETAATGGEISADGSTLVLYQAKKVETQAFNQSISEYSGTGVVTLQLADGQTAMLSGGPATYPPDEITFSLGNVPQDVSTLRWQHRTSIAGAWVDGMPATPGVWQVRCYAPGYDGMYERTYSAPVTLTVVKGTPAASDFVFTAPPDLTYDGSPKAAIVTANDGVTGMGKIAVAYYDEKGEKLKGAPTDAGKYTVKIDVAEGDSFAAASSLTDATWIFTIAKATVTYAAPSAPALQVEYGDSYSDFASGAKLAELLGKLVCGDEELDGSWQADVADGSTVDVLGKSGFKAVFTPSMAPDDMDNYDWAALGPLWDGTIDKISVQVTVNASPRTMDECNVSLTETKFDYSGSEQKPTVVVSDTTKPVAGTDYVITWPTDATNVGQKTVKVAFKGNYTGTINLGYTIARAELKVSSATVSDKTYDGTDAATVAGVEFTGLVGGETLAMGADYTVSDARFADKDAGAGKAVTLTVALGDAGAAKNYEFADGSRSAVTKTAADIEKKGLTVAALDRSVVFCSDVAATVDGPVLDEDYTLSGFAGGENVESAGVIGSPVISVAYTKGETGVGAHGGAVTIERGTLEARNYDFTGFAAADLTVTRSASAIALDDAKLNVTYGDSVIVTGTVSATGQEPGGLLASLMSLVAPAGDQVALYHDGEQVSDPATVEGDGSFSLTYDTTSKVVPAGSEQTLEVRYVGDDNQSEASAEVSLTIGKREVAPVLSGDAAKVYDATTGYAEGEGNTMAVTAEGASGDGDLIADGYKIAWDAAAAGTKGLTAAGIELTDEAAKWYELTSDTATATVEGGIARAELVVAADDKTVAFDGELPELTYVVSGFKGLDDASVVTGEPALACPDYKKGVTAAGEELAIEVGVSKMAADNYTFTAQAGMLTVVTSASAIELDATEFAAIYGDSVTVSGTVSAMGEPAARAASRGTVALFDGAWQVGEPAEVGPDGAFTLVYDTTSRELAPGAHELAVRYAGTGDQAETSAALTLSVNRAELTVTPVAPSGLVYGDPAPATADARNEGWVGSEREELLDDLFSAVVFTTDYEQGADAGTYTASFAWADSEAGAPAALAFYDVTFEPAEMTVGKADVAAIEVGDASKTYDGEPAEAPAVTAVDDRGLASDGAVTVTWLDEAGGQELGSAPTEVGAYLLRVDVAEGTNHTAASDTFAYAILRAGASTVTVGEVEGKAYDGEPVALPEVDLGGFDGEVALAWQVATEDGGWADLAAGELPVDAGTYRLVATAGVSATQEAPLVVNADQRIVIARAAQAAPEGVTALAEATAGGDDGSIAGLPAGSEWRAAGGDWADVPEGGTLAGLAPGAYEVRMAGDKNHEASSSVAVTVASFSATHGGIGYPDGTSEGEGGLPVLPEGGGTVTWPDGTAVELPGGTVVVPGTGVATAPGGTVVAPAGDGSLDVTFPDGAEVNVPDGSAIDGGAVTAPSGVAVAPGEDGSLDVVFPSGSQVTVPGGSAVVGDSVETPDGTEAASSEDGQIDVTFPDGVEVTVPSGSAVGDGVVGTPDGGTVSPDGEGGLVITLPDGAEIAAPGGSSVAGGVVTGPDGSEIGPEPEPGDKPADESGTGDKPADEPGTGGEPAGEPESGAGPEADEPGLAATGDAAPVAAAATALAGAALLGAGAARRRSR